MVGLTWVSMIPMSSAISVSLHSLSWWPLALCIRLTRPRASPLPFYLCSVRWATFSLYMPVSDRWMSLALHSSALRWMSFPFHRSVRRYWLLFNGCLRRGSFLFYMAIHFVSMITFPLLEKLTCCSYRQNLLSKAVRVLSKNMKEGKNAVRMIQGSNNNGSFD